MICTAQTFHLVYCKPYLAKNWKNSLFQAPKHASLNFALGKFGFGVRKRNFLIKHQVVLSVSSFSTGKIDLKRCATPHSKVKIWCLKKLSKTIHDKYNWNYPIAGVAKGLSSVELAWLVRPCVNRCLVLFHFFSCRKNDQPSLANFSNLVQSWGKRPISVDFRVIPPI